MYSKRKTHAGNWGVDSQYYKFRHYGGAEGCAAGSQYTNFRVQARCCMDGNTGNGEAPDLKQLVCDTCICSASNNI